MAACLEFGDRDIAQGAIERAGFGMGENDQDIHGQRSLGEDRSLT
jgi:hypothetical protein